MSTSRRTHPNPTRGLTRASVAVALALVLALPGLTAGRWNPPPTSPSAPCPPARLVAGLVVHDLATGGETPASLAQELVGTGAVVSNVQYTGSPISAGTFTGGGGIIGFERGVVLGSGDVNLVVGPDNTNPAVDNDLGLPGDPDLHAVIGIYNGLTFDASVLEFDLECSAANTISIQYVFSSEEYDNGVMGPFNDGFACFLNGQNIALIPGTNSMVSVQFVNCGRPYNPPAGGVNCGFYITNDCPSLGQTYPCTNLATEMNGLTTVLTATGTLQPGPNHIKLAISDHWDPGVDSNVFIRAHSLDCSGNWPPVFAAPSPCSQRLPALVGVPFSFSMSASSTNGLPGESATLTVAGDPVPLAGGTFTPPLPAGPAQPVSSQFDWTPTLADVGLYLLDFTATDQLGGSAICSVLIEVAEPDVPEFQAPSPCAQIVDAYVGVPMSFGIAVSAVNGVPGESVTLSVVGDPVPLSGGTFVPPLPAGPAPSVTTQFSWTPTSADVGVYPLDFTATDQLQLTATCQVVLRVRHPPATDLCQPGANGVMSCPCGNPPASAPRGCDNGELAGGARLTSVGQASTANDTVVFTTDGERANVLSLLFQGNTLLPSGVRFGQGVRCSGGLLKRLFVKMASADGSITAPGAGDPTVHERSAQRGDPIQNGERRFYAVYYRSQPVFAGCADGLDFNITQAQQILWGP